MKPVQVRKGEKYKKLGRGHSPLESTEYKRFIPLMELWTWMLLIDNN